MSQRTSCRASLDRPEGIAGSLSGQGAAGPGPLFISDIQIIPVKPQGGLLAFASCTINGSLYVGNIAIHSSLQDPGGYRLVYPDKVLPNGKKINCIHPITRDAGEAIRAAIINEFIKVIGANEGGL
jgi:DNA-binding cell septation regulator SpoVG